MSIDTEKPSGKVAFSLVESSTSPDYPNGHLPTAWKALKKKYQPETVTELTTLETQFYASALIDVTSDPDVWIAELENLRTRILMIDPAAKISDHLMILHILSHLPDEYENTIDNCSKQLSAGTLSLEQLKDDVQAKYSRIRRLHKSDTPTNDKALVSMLTGLMERDEAFAAFVQQFKGSCRTCGKYGHKSVDCPDVKQQSQTAGASPKFFGKFSGKCYHCGMPGHRKIDCMQLKRGERANIAFDDDGECQCPCHGTYGDGEDNNELILTAISDNDALIMNDDMSVSARDVIQKKDNYPDRVVEIDGDTFHVFNKKYMDWRHWCIV